MAGVLKEERISESESSDSCTDEEPWIFYRDRPDWADIKPLPLDEGPYPVVAIAYTERFKEVFDYFRAITQKNEISERAFHLTSDALNLNPANYTVWQFRRKLLKGLKKDLNEELVFVRRIIEDNPKNYQVWHHRRILVEWLGDPSKDLRFTEIMLSSDAKNYHAWQHRQWVLSTFNLFDKELEYVERLLKEDVRNNSAWNQRYFVVIKTTGFTEEVITKELNFTISSLRSVCCNESAWNYLRGVLQHHPSGLNGHPVVEDFCQLLESENCRVSFFDAFLVDRMEELMLKQQDLSPQLLPKADQLLQSLATETDPIRKEYWLFLSRYLHSQFTS